ncbi:MAG: hypothetical protein L0H32_14130, partial [Micrococcaceae bacterium]|nr:hypothetical protein [Micrococcaceae bacterium]
MGDRRTTGTTLRGSALVAATLALGLVVAGCTANAPGNYAGNTAASSGANPDRVVLAEPEPGISHLGGDTGDMALEASEAFFAKAPAVVVLGNDDADTSTRAAGRAGELGIPVLMAPEGASEQKDFDEELKRLGAGTLIAY